MVSMLPAGMDYLTILVILCMVSSGLSANTNAMSSSTFNVMNYGAVGDGKSDDSQAFLKAWNAVCQAQRSNPIMVIPAKRTFLLMPVTFNGPCKASRVYVQISGNIVAPNQKSAWSGRPSDKWLAFSNVNGLTVNGRGQIDGRGSLWWTQSCSGSGATCRGPSALQFYRCNGLQLSGLTHINSPRVHIIITSCNGVIVSNLRVIAPETSPNTDGINISGSKNVRIRNSIIGTGDDCIAISGGSSNVNVSGVTCGPGHGISIGALGRGGFDVVDNVHVRNCTLKGTMNGVRLKTWQGGSGYARRITFEKIKFIATGTPIVIDQFYCPTRVNCQNHTEAVKLSDISYTSISGTSTSDKVIDLSCSQSVGCTNIVLDHVYIAPTVPGKRVYANCFNAHGRSTHTKPSVKCLLR